MHQAFTRICQDSNSEFKPEDMANNGELDILAIALLGRTVTRTM